MLSWYGKGQCGIYRKIAFGPMDQIPIGPRDTEKILMANFHEHLSLRPLRRLFLAQLS